MRSHTPFLAFFFVVGALVVPATAHAAIPFFGPIIPAAYNVCPASWGLVITVINNIISLLITLGIVFIAPLMIAYSGFLFVVNPVNPSGKEKAKGILRNTIFGIIIALSGWMIVDAIMAVLYNPGAAGGTWSSLITSGGIDPCLEVSGSLQQAGQPGVTVVPTGCPVPALSPLTDSLALQMEGGQTVIWANTSPQLQSCVNKFIDKVGGGTVTSAYRPQAYQTHLYEIRDRWCTQNLKTNTNTLCSALKSAISAEVTKHGLSACGAVAATNSTHGSGTGVDISFPSNISHGSAAVLKAASESCLTWPNYSNDAVHYSLVAGCSCQ